MGPVYFALKQVEKNTKEMPIELLILPLALMVAMICIQFLLNRKGKE